ncbi:MAG: 50S ribosomal protein L21 [Candidatus Rhabdochlamydia sp.]
MYAIIETGGKQYRVEKDDVIDVELLEAEKGQIVEFTQVLFFNDGKDVKIGAPYVDQSVVKAELLMVAKGPKEIAFKYKQRKGIRKKVGHRQKYHRVKITEIVG